MDELLKVAKSEIDGKWRVFFKGFLNEWTQLGDESFDTEAEAQAFADYQIDNADWDVE
jgi:hypothetical protein